MTIECTKEEKKRIIQAISNGIICPFTDIVNLGLDCPIYKADSCEECLEKMSYGILKKVSRNDDS